MNNLLTVVILFIFISCTNEIKRKENLSNQDENVWYEQEKLKYREMAFEAIHTKNEDLYYKASTWYVLSPSPEDFIYFSTEMAIKNNCAKAYYDIFLIYNSNSKLQVNDSIMINYMLYNLAKSHELGHRIRNEKILDIPINSSNIKPSNYYLKKIGRY